MPPLAPWPKAMPRGARASAHALPAPSFPPTPDRCTPTQGGPVRKGPHTRKARSTLSPDVQTIVVRSKGYSRPKGQVARRATATRPRSKVESRTDVREHRRFYGPDPTRKTPVGALQETPSRGGDTAPKHDKADARRPAFRRETSAHHEIWDKAQRPGTAHNTSVPE